MALDIMSVRIHSLTDSLGDLVLNDLADLQLVEIRVEALDDLAI